MALVMERIETGSWVGKVDDRVDGGTKPIDFTYLKRFTLGNRELEREILYLFAQSAPGYLEQMRQAKTAKEWRDATHTLKGSARAVGAWRVGRCGEAAEKLTFEGTEDRRAFAIDSAAEALDEAIVYIVQQFPEM